jgi:hypothetical protein
MMCDDVPSYCLRHLFVSLEEIIKSAAQTKAQTEPAKIEK